MCELVAQFPKEDYHITEAGVEQLASAAVLTAKSNPDAWGFMSKGMTFRSGNEMTEEDAEYLASRIGDGLPWAVFHTRLGTSGGSGTMSAHPFTHKGWTLVHNGVSRSLARDSDQYTVDSEAMLEKIVETEVEEPKDKIREAMDDYLGRASIFVKTTEGEVYYYRDKANMYKVKGKHSLYMATKEKRLEEMGFDKSDISSVDSYKIFQINGMELNEVAEVEQAYGGTTGYRRLNQGASRSSRGGHGYYNRSKGKGKNNHNSGNGRGSRNEPEFMWDEVCDSCLKEMIPSIDLGLPDGKLENQSWADEECEGQCPKCEGPLIQTAVSFE